MWGVQPESKGQPQKLRQALADYMSVWRTAANIEQNKGGLLSVVNFPQHAVLHLKAYRVEQRPSKHGVSVEPVYSVVAAGTMLTCVSNLR